MASTKSSRSLSGKYFFLKKWEMLLRRKFNSNDADNDNVLGSVRILSICVSARDREVRLFCQILGVTLDEPILSVTPHMGTATSSPNTCIADRIRAVRNWNGCLLPATDCR